MCRQIRFSSCFPFLPDLTYRLICHCAKYENPHSKFSLCAFICDLNYDMSVYGPDILEYLRKGSRRCVGRALSKSGSFNTQNGGLDRKEFGSVCQKYREKSRYQGLEKERISF